MPHKPADLLKKFEAAAPATAVWRSRPMFGGIGVYANDRMCVSLSDIGLAVKLSGEAHAALLKLKGAKPLQYEPSMPPSKTYVVVPAPMLSDAKALGRWLALSAEQASAAPAKKARKSKPKAVSSRVRPA